MRGVLRPPFPISIKRSHGQQRLDIRGRRYIYAETNGAIDWTESSEIMTLGK